MSRLNYRGRFIFHAPELPETQARLRRLQLFEVITGLREIQRRPKFLRLIARRNLDHCSYWSDGLRDFLLSEFYDAHNLEPVPGVAVFELPPEIAPYGGHWSDDPGAQPHTRSLLFTPSKNEAALESLRLRLLDEARVAPRWNALEVE